MPLKVVLQTLQGKRLDEAIPPRGALNRLLPSHDDVSFPLLRFVDPYGNTFFNGNQMYGLLTEWDALEQKAGDDESEFMKKVRAMGETCKKTPHTFLRFIGD
jgi:hypothetical protein